MEGWNEAEHQADAHRHRLTVKLGEDAGIVKAKKLAMRSAKWREDRLEDRGTRDACGLKRKTARSSKKLAMCQ